MILVSEMMSKKVISVGPDTGVKKVCQTLAKNKITGVPVVDKERRILGFVSERDIVAAVEKPNFLKKNAKNIMVKKVYTVEASTSLNEVSQIFTKEPFRHLPVIHNGKLVGMITRTDVVNQMLGHYY